MLLFFNLQLFFVVVVAAKNNRQNSALRGQWSQRAALQLLFLILRLFMDVLKIVVKDNRQNSVCPVLFVILIMTKQTRTVGGHNISS